MATRFYLNRSAPAVSPGYGSIWQDIPNGLSRRRALPDPAGTTLTDADVVTRTLWSNGLVIIGQYVSDPIPAQTVSGTIKSYARALSDGSGVYTALAARVVDGTGKTTRGVLFQSGTTGSAAWPGRLHDWRAPVTGSAASTSSTPTTSTRYPRRISSRVAAVPV